MQKRKRLAFSARSCLSSFPNHHGTTLDFVGNCASAGNTPSPDREGAGLEARVTLAFMKDTYASLRTKCNKQNTLETSRYITFSLTNDVLTGQVNKKEEENLSSPK